MPSARSNDGNSLDISEQYFAKVSKLLLKLYSYIYKDLVKKSYDIYINITLVQIQLLIWLAKALYEAHIVRFSLLLVLTVSLVCFLFYAVLSTLGDEIFRLLIGYYNTNFILPGFLYVIGGNYKVLDRYVDNLVKEIVFQIQATSLCKVLEPLAVRILGL